MLVSEDVSEEKRLMAYVVPASSDVVSATLRDSLRTRLPEHMIPASFVLLDVWREQIEKPLGNRSYHELRALLRTSEAK